MSPMIQIRPPPPHRKRRHCHNESSLTWKCGLETHLEICLKSGSWILTNCVGSMTSRISSSSPRNITCSAVEEGQYQQHTRWLLLLLFWGFFAFSNKWASPLFDCRFLARTSVSLWWPERRCHSSYSWLLFPPPHPPFFFLKYKNLSWNNNNSNVILYISDSVVDVKHFHDKLGGGMKNECHTKMTDRRSCA